MRLTLSAVLLLLSAACRSEQPPAASSPSPEERPPVAAPTPPTARPIVARFQCGDIAVPTVFHSDRVVLTYGEREVVLPQAVSASGARYSDGRVTFWNKGTEATLEMNGTTTTCREVRDSWQAAAQSVGPIRVGMTPAEVDAALGAPAEGGGPGDCVYLRSSRAPAGLLIMVTGGRVARMDVTAKGVPTEAGVEVGATEARVREAYGARAVSAPHKYTDGHYFTVAPDAGHRILFETDGSVVTRYRVGRLPEVEWVEGCS